jgi:dihydroneopterin aldolase
MTDVLPFTPKLDGLVPASLAIRSAKIRLEGLEVSTDIGFHDFEVGAPQRVLVGVEVWLHPDALPDADHQDDAWNYDHLRIEIERIAAARRFNLQETLAREIYDWVAARHGVRALRVTTAKPDIYPNAKSVGVEISSFCGTVP